MILMASRALTAAARSPDEYLRAYAKVLSRAEQKVVIHWLGEMFDPALEGYWGSGDHMAAMETCLAMIEENADKIDGIKISLLSKEKEIVMRRRLPASVRIDVVTEDVASPTVKVGDILQVVGNLLSNAVHAMDGKGTVSIALSRVDEGGRLTVADDGAGMDEPRSC